MSPPEAAEGSRRERDGPGRVELAATDEPPEQIAVRRELVDEAGPGTSGVVVLGGVLLREGDEEVAADVVDPERGESVRERWIGEAVGEVEVTVEHVDPPEAEVACVEELAGRSVDE